MRVLIQGNTRVDCMWLHLTLKKKPSHFPSYDCVNSLIGPPSSTLDIMVGNRGCRLTENTQTTNEIDRRHQVQLLCGFIDNIYYITFKHWLLSEVMTIDFLIKHNLAEQPKKDHFGERVCPMATPEKRSMKVMKHPGNVRGNGAVDSLKCRSSILFKAASLLDRSHHSFRRPLTLIFCSGLPPKSYSESQRDSSDDM